ncbi:SusC/RagA family TonB-linked outer membrane protein [Zobellia sp. OII3]|uniref:SusC/RagA family TonB-linked outer membrane protein n=1 Tax=Zobellia sp. OII3 TaxID=2034520 RepID=UPI001F44F7ED|nr:TonB-dependent receptor [Zobellia sp. OII3]
MKEQPSPETILEDIPIDRGQDFTVTGTITDGNGMPLSGANIVEKGTVNGVTADFDGNFAIEVSDQNGTLVISYIGFATKEVNLNGQTSFSIALEDAAAGLDEVVVIGYGTQKKSDLTGAVATANIDAFRESPNISIVQSLQGSVAGLNIGQVNSAGENPSISVRGRTSINGNLDPLIVLDGIPYSGNISDINPNDIESINVLKDPSSKAIYGAQSANGIILIESKRGGKIKSKPIFSYSGSYTTQEPSNQLTLLDRDGYIEKSILFDFEQTYQAPDYTELKPGVSYLDVVANPELRKGFENGTDYNWWDNATNSGFISTHNLSVQGNTGKTSYMLSGGYTGQQGFIINDKFNRKTARINIETTVFNWLKIGARTFASFSDQSGNSPTLHTLRTKSPLVAPTDNIGNFIPNPDGTNSINPFLTVQGDDLDKRNTIIGNFYADIDLVSIPGLNYTINFGNTYNWNQHYQSNEYQNAGSGSAYKRNNSFYDWTLDNILTYKKTFSEKHDLNVTLLYGRREVNFEETNAQGSNFSSLRLGYNDLSQAGIQEIFSNSYEESYLYQMGRINYDYDDKYLITATLRRDGFSGFSKNKKTAIFPSVALGWNLSKETFFQMEQVNNLKFRFSYGSNGNLVDKYASLAKVNVFPAVVFGDGGSTRFGQTVEGLANPNLSWERTAGYNYGIDFSLFDFRLNGSIDYYTSLTSDLIFDVSIPIITGFDKIITNVGEVKNRGFELNLDVRPIRTDNLKWNVNLNLSSNANEIVSLVNLDSDDNGQEDDLVANNLFIGQSINSIYTYESDGIIQLGEADIPQGFIVGTHRIVDQNGDGGITPEDRVIIGREEPAYRFGILNEIKYKNISLRFFINSIQGGSDGYRGVNNPETGDGDNSRRNNLWSGIDYWTPLNPDAKYRRIDQAPATDFIHYDDRSFIRLQDITLAYRFNSDVLMKNGLKSLKVYLSGKNLWTFTDWNGWDPETGDGLQVNARPVLRGISLGLDISF